MVRNPFDIARYWPRASRLERAILSADPEDVRRLADSGVDVDAPIEHAANPHHRGFTPLMMAIDLRLQGVAMRLIEHGVDLNRQNPAGQTALHLAVERKHALATRMLLKNGAQVNVTDQRRQTALHYAVKFAGRREGSRESIAQLLEVGARLDIRDLWNEAPLHIWLRGSPDEETAGHGIELLSHRYGAVNARSLPSLLTPRALMRERDWPLAEALITAWGAEEQPPYVDEQEALLAEVLRKPGREWVWWILTEYGEGVWETDAIDKLSALRKGELLDVEWYFGNAAFAALSCKFDFRRIFAGQETQLATLASGRDRFDRSFVELATFQSRYEVLDYLESVSALDDEGVEHLREKIGELATHPLLEQIGLTMASVEDREGFNRLRQRFSN